VRELGTILLPDTHKIYLDNPGFYLMKYLSRAFHQFERKERSRMKKVGLLLSAILLVSGASLAQASSIDLTPARGTTVVYDGARFHEFDVADQTSVSSGTGVIDPFLTIQRKGWEHSFNSDDFPVLDATRPRWNHSIQITDLVEYNSGWYEFLLDINEPGGAKSLLTQQELEVYLVDSAYGGSISSLSYLQTVGNLIWDLDRLEDSAIEYDYRLWQGSGQNIDASFELPKDLFAGYSEDTYVYLYAKFGELDPNGFLAATNNLSPSEAGFEEYVLRASGAPVPIPSTVLLLGSGLLGLAGFRRKLRR
jgi:hypothetical protein